MDQYYVYMNTKSEKYYRCFICNETVDTKYEINNHIVTLHKDKLKNIEYDNSQQMVELSRGVHYFKFQYKFEDEIEINDITNTIKSKGFNMSILNQLKKKIPRQCIIKVLFYKIGR